MLQKIKQSLRITHSELDVELDDLINAAKVDLLISGVKNQPNDDALILRAITIYCKAHFGLDNAEAERFEASYTALKSHLSLCGDYNGNV